MKLGYSPVGNGNSVAPFNQLFSEAVSLATHSVAECDAIIMWGGTDIQPKYYNARANPQTYANAIQRDAFEWEWMNEAADLGIPIIGICRGAQFLCALAGGSLVQHVDNHTGGNHSVTVIEDGEEKVYQTTSCHHQMLYLDDLIPGTGYELLGWTANRSSTYQGEYASENLKQAVDPEVVWFPEIKGFAIQGHPEWMDGKDEFVQWCLKTIKQKCFDEEK